MNTWGSWFYKLKVIFKPNESYLTLVQRLKLGKTLLPTGKQNTSLCVSVWLALSLLEVKLQSCSHCVYHCAQAFWTWLATFVAAVVGVAFFSCLCKTEFWLVLATHFACHNFQWEKRSRHTHTHTHGAHTHLQFVAYSPFDSALSAVTCTMCCTHMFSKSHSSADRLSNGIDSGHCVRCCCVWKWESGRCIFMSNGILRIQLRMQYLLN